MGFFKKLSDIFKSPTDGRNYWFYVQCDQCKEVLRGRVDMQNQLSSVYGEGKTDTSYYCRKVLIGSEGCYRPIEVELTFDSNRQLNDRQIKGGEFVTEEVYHQEKGGNL